MGSELGFFITVPNSHIFWSGQTLHVCYRSPHSRQLIRTYRQHHGRASATHNTNISSDLGGTTLRRLPPCSNKISCLFFPSYWIWANHFPAHTLLSERGSDQHSSRIHNKQSLPCKSNCNCPCLTTRPAAWIWAVAVVGIVVTRWTLVRHWWLWWWW